MRSIKDYQKAADLERQKADAERKAAQVHRDKASNYTLKDDPQLPLNENEQARLADERAQQHDKAANKLVQQASIQQDIAIALEREKQEKQQRMQNEVDQLDSEARAIRGE